MEIEKKMEGCGETFSGGFFLVTCGSDKNNFEEIFYCKKCSQIEVKG